MTWLTAFLDFPEEAFGPGVSFWRAATGFEPSPPRGEDGEFATLLPAHTPAFLRVQRVGGGAPRVHLDVHADPPASLVDRAVTLGAHRIADHPVPVLTSPSGIVFCAVAAGSTAACPPAVWGGHRSGVDQVCLDIPPAGYDAECAFWADLLERRVHSGGRTEFRSLDAPGDQQLRVLLQRLDATEPAHAHLDLACDDRPAEVARLVALGARTVRRTGGWTTLLDPVGLPFCVTDRAP